MASILEKVGNVFSNVVNPSVKPMQTSNLGLGEDRIASILHAGRAGVDNYAIDTGWFYSPVFGQPRLDVPPSVLRNFSGTVWVAAAIKTIIDEVCGLEYDIPIKEEFEKNFDQERWDAVKMFFKYPNRNGESISDIWKKYLKDILEFDGGVIVKVFTKESYEEEKSVTMRVGKAFVKKNKCKKTRDVKFKQFKKSMQYILDRKHKKDKMFNPKGDTGVQLNEIYVRDGGSFLINTDIYGILPEEVPAYFQYSYIHPKGAPLGFHKREIVYARMNPRTSSVYGWSPVQSLITVLEALNDGTRFNRDFFRESAVPSGVLSLLGASNTSLKRFRSEWDKNIRGKPHKLVMFNEDTKWQPFTLTNRDMEWLEGQKFYQRLVWAMFGVTADELGFTETSNRSVGQAQSRVFIRRAIKPMIEILQNKFTNEIIAEFYEGNPECELKFDYIDQHEGLLHREQEWKDIEVGVLTINEVRRARGLDPVEGGDKIKGGTPTDSPFEDRKAKPEKEKEAKKPTKEEIESEEEEERKKKEKDKMMSFASWKKKTYQNILKGQLDEKKTPYEALLVDYYSNIGDEVLEIYNEELGKKSLGAFAVRIAKLFAFTTLLGDIKKQVKNIYNGGIKKAEDDLDVDLGVGDSDIPTIEKYVQEQVDGYSMPDGKAGFPGLKGVNVETQDSVMEVVMAGAKAGKGPAQIAENIQGVFLSTKNRAMMIARTETNRIHNAGAYEGYKKSGFAGEVRWMAHIDSKTCPICKALNNEEVEIGDYFEEKGWKGQFAPAHPNCRCTISFKPK